LTDSQRRRVTDCVHANCKVPVSRSLATAGAPQNIPNRTGTATVRKVSAPSAPTAAELATLIRDIGPERVVLGSDYPWYEPAHTAELVLSLPVLSQMEKDAILGENAARLLGLPV